MRIFILRWMHAVSFWLQAAAATTAYQSSQEIDSARLIILVGMTSFVVLPILFGIVYAKYLTFILSEAESKDSKQNVILDSNAGQLISSKAHSNQTRLTDMKMNIVLRLWWKRQEKLYGMSLDHDLELKEDENTKPALPAEAGSESKKEKKEKKAHKKHARHSSEDVIENVKVDSQEPVTDIPKKHKKHVKDSEKKKKKVN